MRAIFRYRIPYPETMLRPPDISGYILHKTIADVDLEGVVVPGLIGRFFQRQEGARIATAGLYSFAGVRLFLSWGYRDDAHCAWTAYRIGDGWTAPHPGCPRARLSADALILDTGPAPIHLPVARVALA